MFATIIIAFKGTQARCTHAAFHRAV